LAASPRRRLAEVDRTPQSRAARAIDLLDCSASRGRWPSLLAGASGAVHEKSQCRFGLIRSRGRGSIREQKASGSQPNSNDSG
jgi:hypothetical protein